MKAHELCRVAISMIRGTEKFTADSEERANAALVSTILSCGKDLRYGRFTFGLAANKRSAALYESEWALLQPGEEWAYKVDVVRPEHEAYRCAYCGKNALVEKKRNYSVESDYRAYRPSEDCGATGPIAYTKEAALRVFRED